MKVPDVRVSNWTLSLVDTRSTSKMVCGFGAYRSAAINGLSCSDPINIRPTKDPSLGVRFFEAVMAVHCSLFITKEGNARVAMVQKLEKRTTSHRPFLQLRALPAGNASWLGFGVDLTCLYQYHSVFPSVKTSATNRRRSARSESGRMK